MGPKTALTLVGLAALIGVGVYLDRKWTSNGGASGVAFNVANVIWDNAAGAVANAGTSLYTDMASFADDRMAQQQAKAPEVQGGTVMPFPTSAWDMIPAGL